MISPSERVFFHHDATPVSAIPVLPGLNSLIRTHATSHVEQTRLATFMRKCRHAVRRLQAWHTGKYLPGCTCNFCLVLKV